MRRVIGLMGTACLLLCGSRPVPAAEAYDPQAVVEGQPPVVTASSEALPLLQGAAEIERVIQQIAQPIDEAQVARLLSSISAVQDPAEQERLQRLLNERLRQVMEAADSAVEAPAQPFTPNAPDDVLMQRIHDLKLGPEATAEDLRARDAAVSAIVGIADPVRREQFLHLLEQREHEAEAPPQAAATQPDNPAIP